MGKEVKIKEEQVNKVLNAINSFNARESYKKLLVPLLIGFREIENPPLDSNIMFVAVNDKGSLEQLISGGKLDKDETIQDKIAETIDDITKEIKDNPLYKNRKMMDYYGKYKTDVFEYEIYVQDVMIAEDKFIRELIAFFVEKEDNEFFQLSVAQGMFSPKDQKLLDDIKDYKKDPLIISLESQLQIILDNLKYKK